VIDGSGLLSGTTVFATDVLGADGPDAFHQYVSIVRFDVTGGPLPRWLSWLPASQRTSPYGAALASTGDQLYLAYTTAHSASITLDLKRLAPP